MTNIYRNISTAARNTGMRTISLGANVAGFIKVAEAMMAQGIV